jgi:hypothetical protein
LSVKESAVEDREDVVETPARKPYEEPTLVVREDLLAVTEGMLVGISESNSKP